MLSVFLTTCIVSLEVRVSGKDRRHHGAGNWYSLVGFPGISTARLIADARFDTLPARLRESNALANLILNSQLTVGKREAWSMFESAQWTLLAHIAATLAMVGLIWFVQIVHYPLFSRVGRESFQRYEMDHQRLTTWVVAPLMLVELATAIGLLWCRPPGFGSAPVWIGLLLLASIWWMTYRVQLPQHASLALLYDDAVQRRLVSGNWYRTAAWTARGLLVLWMVGRVISTTASHSAAIPLANNASS